MSKTDPKGRNRKAAVYAGIPRKARRTMQTAGFRDTEARIAKVRASMSPKHPAGKGVVTGRQPSSNPPLTQPPRDGFHAAIAAPIGKAPPAIDPLRAKRSEAAKRAAATRKANKALKP